jgi:hypothetical protein
LLKAEENFRGSSVLRGVGSADVAEKLISGFHAYNAAIRIAGSYIP